MQAQLKVLRIVLLVWKKGNEKRYMIRGSQLFPAFTLKQQDSLKHFCSLDYCEKYYTIQVQLPWKLEITLFPQTSIQTNSKSRFIYQASLKFL